jgi:hypothetical protein
MSPRLSLRGAKGDLVQPMLLERTLGVKPFGCARSAIGARDQRLVSGGTASPPQIRVRQTVGTVPPSITYSVPVIKTARGEARNGR